MTYNTFWFGILIGYLIGALSYFLINRLMVAEYDRREDKMLANVKAMLDKKDSLEYESDEDFEDG